MKKKINEEQIIRINKGSLEYVKTHNIKSKYYYEEDQKFYLLDNTSGKMKISAHDSIKQMLETINNSL